MRNRWERFDISWLDTFFSLFNANRSSEYHRQHGVQKVIKPRHIDPIRLNPAANTIRLRPGQPLRRPAVRNTLPQHGHDQRQQRGVKAS